MSPSTFPFTFFYSPPPPSHAHQYHTQPFITQWHPSGIGPGILTITVPIGGTPAPTPPFPRLNCNQDPQLADLSQALWALGWAPPCWVFQYYIFISPIENFFCYIVYIISPIACFFFSSGHHLWRWADRVLSLRYWWWGYCVYGFQNLQLIRVSHIPQTTYSFRIQKLYFYGYPLHDCLFRLLKMRLSIILQMKRFVYIRIMRSEIRRSGAQNIHQSLCSFWGCMLLLLKPSKLLWLTANEAEVVDCSRYSFSYHWCMTLRFQLFWTLLGGGHSGKFAGESFARPSWWFGVRMGPPTFTGQRWLNPCGLKK